MLQHDKLLLLLLLHHVVPTANCRLCISKTVYTKSKYFQITHACAAHARPAHQDNLRLRELNKVCVMLGCTCNG